MLDKSSAHECPIRRNFISYSKFLLMSGPMSHPQGLSSGAVLISYPLTVSAMKT